LLPTTDRQAYQEMSLTFQWLLKVQKKPKESLAHGKQSGRHDVRFILRKALHRMKGLKKHFDIVLVDCPPVISLSCVNALAASDYVLIPVTPSKKAVERVPSTLKCLKEIKRELNPALEVLGVVANRTNGATLGSNESEILGTSSAAWHGTWGQEVKILPACFPDRVAVRDAEDNFPPHDSRAIIHPLEALASVIISRMSPHCGPSLSEWSPSQSQPIDAEV
jgi:cellulose biosynthesis protein BcsQ